MAGLQRYLQFGPDTGTANAVVLGGQLVEPDTGGKIKPATANSVKVLGVAYTDAQPAGTNPTSPLNVSWNHAETAIEYGPADVYVTYSASANFGDLLVCTGSGQVGPLAAVTTPTAADVTNTRAIVGRCTDPAGVGSATVGRMRLMV